jgi:two-component system cell cycle sensor histidine kinase/response regulator CckA
MSLPKGHPPKLSVRRFLVLIVLLFAMVVGVLAGMAGLGLAMVDGIVQQSGGSIRVSSLPGEGTTFLILLPRIEMDEESPPLRTSPDKLMTDGRQTVLLVEDEPAVRRLAREILEQGGYEVLEALDGGIAQILATTHPGPIHLLLTDVVMPGVSGPDLATRVRTVRPEIQVIFMSGYSDEAIARHGFAEEGADFFLKPFTPASLLRKVREALAGR